MRRLIAILALVGCSSDQPESSVDPEIVIASITHEKAGITVYKTGDFLMTGNCRGWRGKLTEAELATFQGHLADAAIQTLGRECGEGEYRIRIGGRQSICWTDAHEGAAIQGLTAFFDIKAAMLATLPEGKCDAVQDIGETGWKSENAAAGSGG